MNAWQPIIDRVAPGRQRFQSDLARPWAVQGEQLATILAGNAASAFGQSHDFAALRDADAYRARVPLQNYAHLAPYIERMAAGESRCLCAEPVLLFEETGGSGGARKLIPYTAAGLAAFQAALWPWLGDLLQRRPGISRGRAYWTISPVVRSPRTTAAGLAIGAASDAVYFGDELVPALLQVLAVPPAIGGLRDRDEWAYVTARLLCEAGDLSFISVWSPSFLGLLLAAVTEYGAQIEQDMRRGGCHPALSSGAQALLKHRAANVRGARRLRAALRNGSVDTRLLWPALDTISCWTDASAAAYLDEVRRTFPHAWIQGKGLLSTEAVVSLPLVGYAAPVLALRSGFFEFLDAEERSCLAHELIDGDTYRVVVTTASGLYRYDTGDRVRVRGHAAATPMLEFVGRAGLVSDLCGEKLTHDFVLAQLSSTRGFALLAPVTDTPLGYALYLDADCYSPADARGLAADLDEALCENPQYAYARRLGQLQPIRARRARRPMMSYMAHAADAGQRLGDIKPPVLSGQRGWEAVFSLEEGA